MNRAPLPTTLLALVALLRPSHWIKNLILFAPPLFALRFTDLRALLSCLEAFCCFCCAASAVYALNDVLDLEEDRRHPTKRTRPLAAGLLPTRSAIVLASMLAGAALLASAAISLTLLAVVAGYLSLNLAYSLRLKHIVLVDILVVSSGFLLRILAGSLVTSIPLSMWILIMTFLLSLFLALAKRRDDVLLSAAQGYSTRKVVDGYNLEFVNAGLVVLASVLIVAYIMYTASPAVITRTGTDKLYSTALFVVLGILRYLQLTFVQRRSGNPTRLLWTDRPLQAILLGWLVLFVFLIY